MELRLRHCDFCNSATPILKICMNLKKFILAEKPSLGHSFPIDLPAVKLVSEEVFLFAFMKEPFLPTHKSKFH